MQRMTFVAVENCLTSSVVGMLDIFAVANYLAEQNAVGDGSPVFSTRLVSGNGDEIPGVNGITMKPDGTIWDVGHTDIIFIPAILPKVESVIENSDSIIRWLSNQAERGTMIVSVCTGSFLLAEAGILDGKRATTHWRAMEKFKKRYPQVHLEPKYMIVDEGAIITAGGYYFYQKLALYLIEKMVSRELVTLCAKTMLIDPEHLSQAAFMIFSPQKQHGDRDILRAQKWLDDHYEARFPMDEVAAAAGLGVRNFKRRFTNATGDTPIRYLQRLRVEAAKRYLETSSINVEAITHRVGYEDLASFRRLFKKLTGLSPKAYRNKFSRVYIISS